MDITILGWINGFAGSFALDHLVKQMEENQIFTGNFFLMGFWYLWFSSGHTEQKRISLLQIMLGVFLSIFVARAISHIMPYRPRPYLTNFMHPLSIDTQYHYDQINSSPSDTTAFFMAFGVGYWFISRRIGTFFVILAMTYVTLPRLYLGLHWPSDLAAGWVIGGTVVAFVLRSKWAAAACRDLYRWGEGHPGLFYAMAFSFMCEMATMFENLRGMVAGAHLMVDRYALSQAMVDLATVGFVTAVIAGLIFLRKPVQRFLLQVGRDGREAVHDDKGRSPVDVL